MMPYYSFPFFYNDRNNMNMPASPQMPQAVMPEVTQVQPVQQMMPPMQMCPYLQNNMMPNMMPNMQNMQMPMPALPQGTMPMIMPDNMDMDTMDTDTMDMGPATARPEDPPPVLSNNPPRTSIVLFKELTGYPNYGNPSGNADILYTGNRGTWTFNLPNYLLTLTNFRIQLVIRGVLDDHYNVPVNRYSARITVNGTQVHTGRVSLEHGTPSGGRFNNWRSLTFNIDNPRRNNRVVIVNTSETGPNDWIALDWMELRLIPR